MEMENQYVGVFKVEGPMDANVLFNFPNYFLINESFSPLIIHL